MRYNCVKFERYCAGSICLQSAPADCCLTKGKLPPHGFIDTNGCMRAVAFDECPLKSKKYLMSQLTLAAWLFETFATCGYKRNHLDREASRLTKVPPSNQEAVALPATRLMHGAKIIKSFGCIRTGSKTEDFQKSTEQRHRKSTRPHECRIQRSLVWFLVLGHAQTIVWDDCGFVLEPELWHAAIAKPCFCKATNSCEATLPSLQSCTCCKAMLLMSSCQAATCC